MVLPYQSYAGANAATFHFEAKRLARRTLLQPTHHGRPALSRDVETTRRTLQPPVAHPRSVRLPPSRH